MAKVNEGSMRQWLDGETIHAAEYNNERTLIIKAFNDTDRRVDDAVMDMKAPFSVNTGMIADGAVTPTKIVKETVTQYAYDKTETDQRIIDALTDGIPQEVIDAIVLGAAQTVTNHANDQTIHVTAAKQAAWNAKETPEGAQTKATQALADAKTYTDQRPWQKHRLAQDNGSTINIHGLDLNNIVLTGHYSGAEVLNSPIAGFCYLTVETYTNNAYVVQTARSLYTNSYYQRVRTSESGWLPWSPDLFAEVAAAKQSGVDAKNGVTASLNAMGVHTDPWYTWSDLSNLIRAINTGKKWAKGQFTVNTSSQGSVGGLAFQPKNIIISSDANVSEKYVGVYSGDSLVGGAAINFMAGQGTGGWTYPAFSIGANNFSISTSQGTNIPRVYNYFATE